MQRKLIGGLMALSAAFLGLCSGSPASAGFTAESCLTAGRDLDCVSSEGWGVVYRDASGFETVYLPGSYTARWEGGTFDPNTGIMIGGTGRLVYDVTGSGIPGGDPQPGPAGIDY
jgi:hypothetical protein